MPSKHCAENELNPMFLTLKYKGRGKTCHMHIPRDEHDKKSRQREKYEKEIYIRNSTQAIPSQAARLIFASSVVMMNFEFKQILLFASERNAPPSLVQFLASSAILPTID